MVMYYEKLISAVTCTALGAPLITVSSCRQIDSCQVVRDTM
jgi:hypothetical protein